jgi:hypothetical protein
MVTQKKHRRDVRIVLDVGDGLDLYCRRAGHLTFCYKNTENGDQLTDDAFSTFPVDRCMDSTGKVMFMHLGRGTDKMANRYMKTGRVLKNEWVTFCQQFI